MSKIFNGHAPTPRGRTSHLPASILQQPRLRTRQLCQQFPRRLRGRQIAPPELHQRARAVAILRLQVPRHGRGPQLPGLRAGIYDSGRGGVGLGARGLVVGCNLRCLRSEGREKRRFDRVGHGVGVGVGGIGVGVLRGVLDAGGGSWRIGVVLRCGRVARGLVGELVIGRQIIRCSTS